MIFLGLRRAALGGLSEAFFGLPGRRPKQETFDDWRRRLSVCSVDKKYVFWANELFKIRYEVMLHTSIHACIGVGVLLLLVLALLSILTTVYESMLVSLLSLH